MLIPPGSFRLFVFAALILAAGCSVSEATTPRRAGSAAVAVDAYLAPDLDPGERDYFRRTLPYLPLPGDWDLSGIDPAAVSIAVIDGATNSVHYNRAQDVGSWRQGSPNARIPFGEPPAAELPRSATLGSFDPGVTSNTGPYRRVYIQVPGLSANDSDQSFKGVKSTVTIDCKNGFHRPGDEGHVYLGGWSPHPADVAGNVDAGLMYNYKQRPTSNDDYTLFINLAGWDGGTGGSSYWFEAAPPGDPHDKVEPHLSCGGPVQMVFGVVDLYGAKCKLSAPDCSRYYMLLAVFAPGPFKAPLRAVVWAPPYLDDVGTFLGGWGKLTKDSFGDYATVSPCNGCVFKFMTSIAQKPPGDYTDMSTFSATWGARSITCELLDACGEKGDRFIPLPAATVDCSEYPLWESYQNGPRDCRDTPERLKGIPRSVGVSDYAATGETDDIRLIY